MRSKPLLLTILTTSVLALVAAQQTPGANGMTVPPNPQMPNVLAQDDPLRREGERYAEKLKNAGVSVEARTYDGVPHEFFGMGAVVDEAKGAETQVANGLKGAFAR